MIFTHGCVLGIESADVREGDWVRRMPGEAAGHFAIALVIAFEFSIIKLVVRIFPTFFHESRPFAGRAEEVKVVIEPNR